jgi:hypothetical protein
MYVCIHAAISVNSDGTLQVIHTNVLCMRACNLICMDTSLLCDDGMLQALLLYTKSHVSMYPCIHAQVCVSAYMWVWSYNIYIYIYIYIYILHIHYIYTLTYTCKYVLDVCLLCVCAPRMHSNRTFGLFLHVLDVCFLYVLHICIPITPLGFLFWFFCAQEIFSALIARFVCVCVCVCVYGRTCFVYVCMYVPQEIFTYVCVCV